MTRNRLTLCPDEHITLELFNDLTGSLVPLGDQLHSFVFLSPDKNQVMLKTDLDRLLMLKIHLNVLVKTVLSNGFALSKSIAVIECPPFTSLSPTIKTTF